jgi:hypothetical protein
MLNEHMFAGILGGELMVRLEHDAAQRALERDHAREMDFPGRPVKNMIFVQSSGLRGAAVTHWITTATDQARIRPPKQRVRPARHQPDAGTEP